MVGKPYIENLDFIFSAESQSIYPTFVFKEGSSFKLLANCSQVGIKVLQWPHHGAYNIKNQLESGYPSSVILVRSLKFSSFNYIAFESSENS